jgi:arylsulfatase A-like enzyme
MKLNKINELATTITIMLMLSLQTSFSQYDPKQAFQGKVGKTIEETRQWYPAKQKALAGAPNVIWILIDDAGYGATSAFGGLIETPFFEQLASNGLRYTNFHNVGVCSPTRAALLTGRNSHAVGFGYFASNETTPGYNGRLPFETGTIAETLKENGYNTFAVGKWHVLPHGEETQAGPFNRWPLGRGFEQYYGFLGGATDQWHPELWEGNQKLNIEPNKIHLTELLADKSINFIANQKSADPDKPFFLYLAPGATHSPHQAPKEWIDKYKGKFDKGWDWYRQEIFNRQLKLGVIPKGTVLPPRDPHVKAWNSLSADQKKLYARFMEVYAAYMSHADYEIGRIFSYLKQIGQYDNTLVIAVLGDNGGTRRGEENGTLNEQAYIPKTEREKSDEFAFMLTQKDKIGGELSYPVYPEGWGHGDNTPFLYWKYDANGEGATHAALIISYPKGINERGIRQQYGHVIDLLPTTIALTGTKIPEVINGYKQDPVQGIDLSYSFRDSVAPSKRTLQYYEIAGNRAIYKDGWKAEAYHNDGKSFDNDKWQLFHLSEDWSESSDLASKNPEKLAELKEVFHQEAAKYNIYPLKGRTYIAPANPETPKISQVVLYPGVTKLQATEIPQITKGHFSITAYVDNSSPIGEGALFAEGGKNGGLSLFIKEGKLQFAQTDGAKTFHLVSTTQVPKGKSELTVEYLPADNVKNGGSFTLFINKNKVAAGKIDKSPFARINYSAVDEGIEVGKDSNIPVSDNYKAPFAYTGNLSKVVIETN